MATIKVGAYGTATTVLATELNSLANGSVSGVSGAGTGTIYDNHTNLDGWGMPELNATFASAPTHGTVLELHAYDALDASFANFETALAAGTTAPDDVPVCLFVVNGTGTTQRLHPSGPVTLPPGKVKYALVNRSGVALSASGNTVSITPFDYTVA